MTQLSSYNEAITRAKLIDPALQQAGWDTGNPQQVGKEIFQAIDQRLIRRGR